MRWLCSILMHICIAAIAYTFGYVGGWAIGSIVGLAI